MSKTRLMITAALLAAISAIFQSLPAILSELVVFLTIVSALPIYIAARLKPTTGILSYFVAGFLVMLLSSHEALFFLCSNGMIGLSLGICRYFKMNKLTLLALSSFAVTGSLCIMNYGIGIPVLGTDLPGNILLQLLILYGFCFIYNFLFLIPADIIYKRIEYIRSQK